MENPSVTDPLQKENPVSSSENNATSSCQNTITNEKVLKTLLSLGNLNFSLRLYRELRSSGKNVCFSPLSVRMGLAIASEGTAGTTLTRINDVLELDEAFEKNEARVAQAFKVYLHSLSYKHYYDLSTAHRIYARRALPIFEPYARTLSEMYSSSVVEADFADDASGTANEMNRWMEQQTKSAGEQPVPPESISTETVLLLTNAAYFRGNFQVKFNSAATEWRAFEVSDEKIIQVPTMRAVGKFECVESDRLSSRVLQLRYEMDRLALHVILPYEGISSTLVQPELTPKNVWDYTEALSASTAEYGEVFLPKFRAVGRDELKGPLSSMGMAELFGESVDLSRMSGHPGVRVSSAIHHTHVVVEDTRTNRPLAKWTVKSLNSFDSSSPTSFVFRADRPFIYLIYDLEFQQILFMGNVDDPSIS